MAIIRHGDTICVWPSTNLFCGYPVVAVLPLPADLTASCPVLHIFGGFWIYAPLNVQILVWAIAGKFFLSIEKSEIKRN